MNEEDSYQYQSRGFISINVGHIVAQDTLKLNNTINTCLIRPKIHLYYSLALSIYECLIYQIYQ